MVLNTGLTAEDIVVIIGMLIFVVVLISRVVWFSYRRWRLERDMSEMEREMEVQTRVTQVLATHISPGQTPAAPRSPFHLDSTDDPSATPSSGNLDITHDFAQVGNAQ